VGEPGRTPTCPECRKPYVRGGKFCAHCGTLLSNLELDLLDLDGSDCLAAGTLIGTYRLVELLGEGGMGRVYVAEHVKLGRRVAIKKLRRELVSNPSVVARFFAEARAVNRISHENIVEITDLIEEPGGDNYIVMELLKGEDLGARLRRLQRLPLARAFEIAAQTAGALAAVHAAGMTHAPGRRTSSRCSTSASPSSPIRVTAASRSTPPRRGRSSARPSTCRPSRRAVRWSTFAPTSTRSA
jgi:serine/threonine-protein kinase